MLRVCIVKNRDSVHNILGVLNKPSEGEPCVEKTYSRSSPLQRFMIGMPGLLEIHTFVYL